MHKIKLDGTSANAFAVGDNATTKIQLKNTAGVASVVSLADAAALSADSLVDGSTNHAFTAADDAKLGKVDRGGSYTIGAAGDYATLAAALAAFDRFEGTTWTLLEDVSEAFGPGDSKSGSLTIVGDTRALAGVCYVHGAAPSSGYGTALAGSGAATLSNSGNDIVVACATTNPDFSTLAAGDLVSVVSDAGARTVETVYSVSSNTITLTGTAPTVGGSGSSVCILPNRKWSYGGNLLTVGGGGGLTLEAKGVRFVKTGTAAATAISVAYPLNVLLLANCVVETESTAGTASSILLLVSSAGHMRGTAVALLEADCFGARANTLGRIRFAALAAVSSKAGHRPVSALNESDLYAIAAVLARGYQGLTALAASRASVENGYVYGFTQDGIYATSQASIYANAAVIDGCGDGADAASDSQILLGTGATVKNCTVGIREATGGRVRATSPTMSGNTADYARTWSEQAESFVFNDDGLDADFRVEGNGDANLLYLDAGNDRVGVGTAAPDEKLDVRGNAQIVGNEARKNATYGGSLNLVQASAQATLSGASTTIQVNVPAYAVIRAVALKVHTLITSGDGGATWSAALSGGSTAALASGAAFAQNTAASKSLWEEVASETDIAITPNSGTFSGGGVTAVVWYETITALTNFA